MTKAEEKRMEKAKALRYRKPAVKDLNLTSILTQQTEIEEACADVEKEDRSVAQAVLSSIEENFKGRNKIIYASYADQKDQQAIEGEIEGQMPSIQEDSQK